MALLRAAPHAPGTVLLLWRLQQLRNEAPCSSQPAPGLEGSMAALPASLASACTQALCMQRLLDMQRVLLWQVRWRCCALFHALCSVLLLLWRLQQLRSEAPSASQLASSQGGSMAALPALL
jgi:hypothetical protein